MKFFKTLRYENKKVKGSAASKDTGSVQTKTRSLANRYNNWWERENAKAFLRQYPHMVRGYLLGQTSL